MHRRLVNLLSCLALSCLFVGALFTYSKNIADFMEWIDDGSPPSDQLLLWLIVTVLTGSLIFAVCAYIYEYRTRARRL